MRTRLERNDCRKYATVAEMMAAYAAARARLGVPTPKPKPTVLAASKPPPKPMQRKKAPAPAPRRPIFNGAKAQVAPKLLIDKVCDYYGVHVDAVVNSAPGKLADRHEKAVRARHTIIWLMRRVGGASIMEAGRALGGFTDSCITLATQRIDRLIERNETFRSAISQLVAWAKKQDQQACQR
jgi:hypothetical protein